MSRRYSDAPINLIARIPTPEQISAARTKKRSFSETAKESTAACLGRVAEMGMRLSRLGHAVVSFVGGQKAGLAFLGQADEKVAGETGSAANTSPVSADRAPGGVERMQAAVPPVEPATAHQMPVAVTAPEPAKSVIDSVTREEVAALRKELAAQQQEVARLSAQLQELKSLVGSQEQVLMYLGQEMEAQQMPIIAAAALAPPSQKKPRVARAKSSAAATSGSRKVSQRPALNL